MIRFLRRHTWRAIPRDYLAATPEDITQAGEFLKPVLATGNKSRKKGQVAVE